MAGRDLTDVQLEEKLQELGRERRAIVEEARGYRQELDRRLELERFAQEYAEGKEPAREQLLARLSDEDANEVLARAERWASYRTPAGRPEESRRQGEQQRREQQRAGRRRFGGF